MILVTFRSNLDLRAFENAPLEVSVVNIHPLHQPVGTGEIPGFDSLPDGFNFRWRKGNKIGNGPHEREGRGSRLSIFVVSGRLWLVSMKLVESSIQ